jgi:hypothetical protein
MCYTFNGTLICHEKRPRYFEEQYEYRCGLHALNNLFQNQTLVYGVPIIKYNELFDFCRHYFTNCHPKGGINTNLLQDYILNLNFNAKIGYDTNVKKYLEFMQHNKNIILGAIVLYQAPNCSNHYVSLICEGPYFLVIDSISDGRAKALDTLEQVVQYFQVFKCIILVGI